MRIEVVSSHFKDARKVITPQRGFYPMRRSSNLEAGITISIDGEILTAELRLTPEVAEHAPYEYLMAQLRAPIMAEIEKRLFNDFNHRPR